MKAILISQLVLGIWLLAAPWILGYASLTPALWGSVVVGVFISLLSLWGLFGIDESHQKHDQ